MNYAIKKENRENETENKQMYTPNSVIISVLQCLCKYRKEGGWRGGGILITCF